VGRIKGISEQQLASLAAFETRDAFTEPEKLRYAEALTQTRANVAEELFNSLREHFSPQQIVELTVTTAWENFRARFNRGFGIESEGFSEGATCAVHVTMT
jgi:alkylhydroperoxidase family enzyme